jgi:hypothetical protein
MTESIATRKMDKNADEMEAEAEERKIGARGEKKKSCLKIYQQHKHTATQQQQQQQQHTTVAVGDKMSGSVGCVTWVYHGWVRISATV